MTYCVQRNQLCMGDQVNYGREEKNYEMKNKVISFPSVE